VNIGFAAHRVFAQILACKMQLNCLAQILHGVVERPPLGDDGQIQTLGDVA
jgi:hypothetical protein